MTRHARAGLALLVGASSCGGEGLPEIAVKLSKNCNDVEVQSLIPRVPLEAGSTVLDVATDSTVTDAVWILLVRPTDEGDDELVVQLQGPDGVESEFVLDTSAVIAPALSLQPAPDSGQVWVVREEPGVFELWRIDPDDPLQPILPSENLSSFPTDGPLCNPCDSSEWPRRLYFMEGQPAVVSLPTFSVDAGLVVWAGRLDTSGLLIRMADEHRLSFEPPCEGDTPEAQAACAEQRMNLIYPEITLLGVQEDPRRDQTMLFGHRTRAESYAGDPFPLESADVFMVGLFLDGDNRPEGVLRSYSGFYTPEGPIDASAPPLPSATPPFGIAVDRFAAYGLFSNGGVLPRLIQLPEADPDFEELSGRVTLELDTELLQMDRDLAMGRLVDGEWEVTKLFPDEPSQSGVLVYGGSEPITEVVSGGVGTFMLRKGDAAPEVVRLRCPQPDP